MSAQMEILIRFFVGGVVVSAFSIIGGLFKPTSFAGLFSAAPSVALATLGLAITQQGAGYAAIECRSMLIGAVALGIYSLLVSRLLMKHKLAAASATLLAIPLWFVTAFGLWSVFLR